MEVKVKAFCLRECLQNGLNPYKSVNLSASGWKLEKTTMIKLKMKVKMKHFFEKASAVVKCSSPSVSK